jgi:hypothetical protein
MSRNQRKHTTEAKLVPAETISDRIRPEAGETKGRPKQSAVQPNDPAIAQALSVPNERSSGKTVPRLKVVKDGDTTKILFDPFELRLLMQALGTEDADFAQELLLQVAYAHPRRDEAGINFLLSVIKGVKPKDQLEGCSRHRWPSLTAWL